MHGCCLTDPVAFQNSPGIKNVFLIQWGIYWRHKHQGTLILGTYISASRLYKIFLNSNCDIDKRERNFLDSFH